MGVEVNLDPAGIIREIKDTDTFRETDRLFGLIPIGVHALFADPEIWARRKIHRVKLVMSELNSELEKMPAEKIVEPPEYVAVPAIQAISYSVDSEELRSMYVKLLAKSMNSDTTQEVHPAMVEVIKQMSPLEAQILNSLGTTGSVAYFNLVRKKVGKTGAATIYRHISKYDSGDEVPTKFHPLPSSVAISNLGRLGIFELHDDAWLTDAIYYENIVPASFTAFIDDVNKIYMEQQDGFSLVTQKGYASLTQFGKAFAKICVN